MKYVKLLLVCIMVMFLAGGCQNKQATNNKGNVNTPIGGGNEGEYVVHDALYENFEPGVKFVAVKLLGNEYIPSLDNEGNGTYYRYYQISGGDEWINPEYIELPVDLQLGEFAYLKADTTFITGGYDGRMHVEFKDIEECRKISIEEATELLKITDLYECERQYLYGFSNLAIHSKLDGYLIEGSLGNRYIYLEDRENSFDGEVTVYKDSEVIGQFNRLEFVGDYLVLFSSEDRNEVELPENITVENIEELLVSGKQYNDYMLVLHKRAPGMNAYYSFILGDLTFLDEMSAATWYIPEFRNASMRYECSYLDLDGDGSEELLIRWRDGSDGYYGVFHYEDRKVVCWLSDTAEMSEQYYTLQDGTMVKQYDYAGTRTYTLFRYNPDGTMENITTLFAREELIPEDSMEKCPYYAIDGQEVDESEFDEQLNLLIHSRKLKPAAWIKI